MPVRVETHICQWGTDAETEVNGIGQWRCQLSWSDGRQCDQSTSDPSVITQAYSQIQFTGLSMHEIMRRRYYYGEFGNTHVLMGPAEFAHVRRWSEALERPSPDNVYRLTDALERPSFQPDPMLSPERAMQQLLGIPVVVDESMPEDTWKLVSNRDHSKVLHEGSLSAECPNRTTQDPMEQCYNCEMPFDVIRHRYLCPNCKTKNSCCF